VTNVLAIDRLLAAALRDGAPPERTDVPPDRLLARMHRHGIAGLLAGQKGWPEPVSAAIRAEALARGMWELRHRQLLGLLLKRLEAAGVRALLLKGTALAYDLYDEPAKRSRGDSDLWVPEEDRQRAGIVLRESGFVVTEDAVPPPGVVLQEDWLHRGTKGAIHAIDLHWSAINSPHLRELFDFERCWSQRRTLAKLGTAAWGLSLEDALLHTAVHRAMHDAAGYRVAGVEHHGGDRLIWTSDIALLVRALGGEGLRGAMLTAHEKGIARVLRSALKAARDDLGASVPGELLHEPGTSAAKPPERYLAAGRLRRAWLDLGEAPDGTARLRSLKHKLLPSHASLKDRYGERTPAALHWRRWMDILGLGRAGR
jgi:hypothetical protein